MRAGSEIAERTLRASWIEGERDGVPYAYAPPSPSHYYWQWYWDSCFHAIVWRRFEPERSRLELESLLNGGSDDGFIGHTIFWDRPVDMRRRWTYNISLARRAATPRRSSRRCWPGPGGSPSATPPRTRGSPPTTAGSSANRDLDGDGLLWIVQPDESGLDSSPKFDPVWGRRAHAHLGFIALIQRNRRREWNARRILDDGGPLLCEVVVNVLWGLARLAAGEPSITPALIERCWDERRGLFLDVARGEHRARGRDRPARRRPPGPDLDLVGAGAAGAARPARGDRPPPGRGAPARPRALLDPLPAALGLAPGARASSPATGRPGWCAATGAGRPGSTRPG